MLMPKDGVSWKAAQARLPPTRAVWTFLTRTRFLLVVAIVGLVILLWRGVTGTAEDLQK
jgi:hypothetical protein